jgi:hypothetical protein
LGSNALVDVGGEAERKGSLLSTAA